MTPNQTIPTLTQADIATVMEITGCSVEQVLRYAAMVGDESQDVYEPEAGVVIVSDEPKAQDAPKEEIMDVQPKADKVKCKCCGFAKKARRVNAEGICKTCYVALATSDGEAVTVVGRQGKRGRNNVSVMIGGSRVKVQRKVRLES
jgi:hypothetical protein